MPPPRSSSKNRRARYFATIFARASNRSGGAEGDRTLDLRLAKPALSQLSYGPTPEPALPGAESVDGGGPGWTRTTDLTLIRRAL